MKCNRNKNTDVIQLTLFFDKTKFLDEAAYEEAAIFSATLMQKSQSDQTDWIFHPEFLIVALSP